MWRLPQCPPHTGSVVLQTAHAPPPRPQKASVAPSWQTVPSQQPVGQLAFVQVQLPETQSCPVGQVPLGQLALQAVQAPPQPAVHVPPQSSLSPQLLPAQLNTHGPQTLLSHGCPAWGQVPQVRMSPQPSGREPQFFP